MQIRNVGARARSVADVSVRPKVARARHSTGQSCLRVSASPSSSRVA